MRHLTLYFDYGSPYSYLAWRRITGRPAAYANAEVAWRPVSAGHIFRREGGKPNAEYPNLARYNERDLARWAEMYGVPLRIPPKYPQRTLEASRIHYAVESDAPTRTAAWMEAVFTFHWCDGGDLEDPAALAALADAVGVAPSARRVADAAVKAQLVAATEEAYAAGAPGVPYAVLDGEGYWGNDRLAWVEAQLAGTAPPS